MIQIIFFTLLIAYASATIELSGQDGYFTFTNCGGNVVNFENALIFPFPLEQHSNVDVGALAKTIITGGTFHLKVQIGSLQVVDMSVDICSWKDTGLSCPIQPGQFNAEIGLIGLKSFPVLPVGRYLINAQVRDTNNRTIGCGAAETLEHAPK